MTSPDEHPPLAESGGEHDPEACAESVSVDPTPWAIGTHLEIVGAAGE